MAAWTQTTMLKCGGVCARVPLQHEPFSRTQQHPRGGFSVGHSEPNRFLNQSVTWLMANTRSRVGELWNMRARITSKRMHYVVWHVSLLSVLPRLRIGAHKALHANDAHMVVIARNYFLSSYQGFGATRFEGVEADLTTAT